MIEDLLTSSDAAGYFRARRWGATARTWVGKASWALRLRHDEATSEAIRTLCADDAGYLALEAIEATRRLVPILREEGCIIDSEWVEREARALVRDLRAHRLAGRLADTTGRTEAEAETFRAAASTLTARVGT